MALLLEERARAVRARRAARRIAGSTRTIASRTRTCRRSRRSADSVSCSASSASSRFWRAMSSSGAASSRSFGPSGFTTARSSETGARRASCARGRGSRDRSGRRVRRDRAGPRPPKRRAADAGRSSGSHRSPASASWPRWPRRAASAGCRSWRRCGASSIGRSSQLHTRKDADASEVAFTRLGARHFHERHTARRQLAALARSVARRREHGDEPAGEVEREGKRRVEIAVAGLQRIDADHLGRSRLPQRRDANPDRAISSSGPSIAIRTARCGSGRSPAAITSSASRTCRRRHR